MLVNLLRERENEGKDAKPVSWSAVNNFAARSTLITTHKRGTKKSRKDKDSAWAKARLAQCRQWRDQFDASRPLPAGCHRANIEAVAWWDEHHKKTRLGHASKWENKVARHPESGLPCIPENGGVVPDSRPVTTQKFAHDARGCFGVAMRCDEVEGTRQRVGVRLEPFNYTGKTVVGVKLYKTAFAAELRRVIGMKGQWKGYKDGYDLCSLFIGLTQKISACKVIVWCEQVQVPLSRHLGERGTPKAARTWGAHAHHSHDGPCRR